MATKLGAKRKALFRIRRYARRSAEARLQGRMQNAQRWDDEIEKVYSEAKRRGWSEDPFVTAEEKGRHEAERLVRSHKRSRDPSKGKGRKMAGRPRRRRRRLKMLKAAVKHRRHRGRRDWRGNPKGHANAARKGWKVSAKPGWKPKRRSSKKRRDMDDMRDPGRRRHRRHRRRDWPGARRRHAKAAALGWHEHARVGWRPKRMTYTGVLASTAKKHRRKKRDMDERDPRRHRRHHRRDY
jgi:hypothetical protein